MRKSRRIRIKREKGISARRRRVMRVPLPGARRIFSHDLQIPRRLAESAREEVEYDPPAASRSSSLITYARKVVISLVRWLDGAILERRSDQPSSGRHTTRGADGPRSARARATRARVEGTARPRGRREPALGVLPGALRVTTGHSAASEAFVDLYHDGSGCSISVGRGIFLELLRTEASAGMASISTRAWSPSPREGLEAHEVDALTHLSGRGGSIDGLYARHLAEHTCPAARRDTSRVCAARSRRRAARVRDAEPKNAHGGAHTF